MLTPEQIDALPAGPEMDALVAEHIEPNLDEHGMPLAFSTNIAAAWVVRERLRALGWRMQLVDTRAGNVDCVLYDGRTQAFAIEPTAPLAICRAALRAVQGAK